MKRTRTIASLAGLAVALCAYATSAGCPWPISPYFYGGDGCGGGPYGDQIDDCTQPTVVQGGCSGSENDTACYTANANLTVPEYDSAYGGP